MQNKSAILEPEATYHVYNRANGQEKLFVSEENYRYSLQKYYQYISPIADTFCYCLMPNHFHFLIRIKKEEELIHYFEAFCAGKNLQGFKNLEGLEKLISSQFSNFFNAYSKAFNKLNNRKGSLFMHTFKRKRVNGMDYLRKLVIYIHRNPIEANLCKKSEYWPHSSYSNILSGTHHFLNGDEVVTWFEDRGNFQYMHSKQPLFEPESL